MPSLLNTCHTYPETEVLCIVEHTNITGQSSKHYLANTSHHMIEEIPVTPENSTLVHMHT